jgi:hypothetical protein
MSTGKSELVRLQGATCANFGQRVLLRDDTTGHWYLRATDQGCKKRITAKLGQSIP